MPKPITSFAVAGHAGRGVVERATSAVASVLTSFQKRKALREIAALDDRLLDDLGLQRSDVEHAIHTADARDPIRALEDARYINATHRFRRDQS